MHTLSGKRVAFCGRMTCEKRSLIIARLEMMGGRHVEKVTTKTDILVLPHAFDMSEKPKQLLDAEALQKQGRLRIMDEYDFVALIKD